ncbi:MAG: TetR/AcrR family transcriptional regulator C-terminal domain-containing protein, partial [Myxococcales bacterium]|nr:TetR/AcrR family transcriptional regulator C-terminal domain-containing protein [Myxococcales bacterium]
MERRRRSAEPLTLERIVEAALVELDASGADGVSLRGVARRLGVHVTSLYNHVPSKPALLDAMVDRALSGITPPDPHAPWQERVRTLAVDFYQALAAHPALIPVLASERGRPTSPGLFAVMEAALTCLSDAGLSPSHQVSAFRGFLAMVMGLVITHTRGAESTLEAAELAWREAGMAGLSTERQALMAL